MINSDSSENDSQMALTIGLIEAFKNELKIHASSEESNHSLDYSSTFSTALDNPFIRAIFQNQFKLMAKIRCLEDGMDSLKTQLRNKPPPVAALPWKFGNPFSNNEAGSKSLSRAKNYVPDTVAGS